VERELYCGRPLISLSSGDGLLICASVERPGCGRAFGLRIGEANPESEDRDPKQARRNKIKKSKRLGGRLLCEALDRLAKQSAHPTQKKSVSIRVNPCPGIDD
jgi:hypothetical protein